MDLVAQMADLMEEDAVNTVKERLANGEDPMGILDDTRKATEIVGTRFSAGEYFIPELLYSGEILKKIVEVVKPKMSAGVPIKHIGKVVLGTVAGDVHDIGLDIVDFILDANGFQVFNLGVDVPPNIFVDKIKETNSPIVGLSGLLTLAYDSMKNTIKAIEDAGLREQVKIMIGGSQVDEMTRDYVRADGFGTDAMSAVTMAKKWIGAN